MVTAAQDGGGSDSEPFSGPHTGTLTNTTLTTTSGGSVFAYGHTDISVSCAPQTGFNCHFDLVLELDGQPVPGSDQFLLIQNATSSKENVELFGIAPHVPAGVHHLTIAYDGDSPNPGSSRASAARITLPRSRSAADDHASRSRVGSGTPPGGR